MRFFSLIPIVYSMYGMTIQTEFGVLRSYFYAALHMSSFGGFYRLCFDYYGFSLKLKGFNIGHIFTELNKNPHYNFLSASAFTTSSSADISTSTKKWLKKILNLFYPLHWFLFLVVCLCTIHEGGGRAKNIPDNGNTYQRVQVRN